MNRVVILAIAGFAIVSYLLNIFTLPLLIDIAELICLLCQREKLSVLSWKQISLWTRWKTEKIMINATDADMFQFLIELPLKESLLRCMEKWSLSSKKRAYPMPVCKHRTYFCRHDDKIIHWNFLRVKVLKLGSLFCVVIVKFSKGLMVKRCELNVVWRTY